MCYIMAKSQVDTADFVTLKIARDMMQNRATMLNLILRQPKRPDSVRQRPTNETLQVERKCYRFDMATLPVDWII